MRFNVYYIEKGYCLQRCIKSRDLNFLFIIDIFSHYDGRIGQVSGRKINFLIDVLSLDRNFVYLSKIYCAYFLFISSMFILLLKEMFALH